MLLAAALGALVGFVLALTGAGGAIIAVPLLVFGFDLDLAQAAPIALLAVLRCGAAYLPLDVDYPRERLQYMLDDAQPVCVLTTTSVADRIEWMSVPMLTVDTTCVSAAALPPVPSAGDDLAYVIHTSGTTGKPKGVLHTSGGYLTFASLTHEKVFDVHEDDIYFCEFVSISLKPGSYSYNL